MGCLRESHKADNVGPVEENQVQCRKCGFIWVVVPKKKHLAQYCASCRAKPAKMVKYNGEICVPFHGKFDRFDRPIVDGVLFMPGDRICGHSDCVAQAHIVGGNK
jgi:hypothetical protein